MRSVFVFFVVLNFVLSFESDYYESLLLNNGRHSKEQNYETSMKVISQVGGSTSIMSDCYLQAMEEIERGCKGLSDDTTRRMFFFSLTNCHLKLSGRTYYTCDSKKDNVGECVSKLSSEDFTVFSTFFLHIENICFYLSHDLFVKKTENQIVDILGIFKTTHLVLEEIKDESLVEISKNLEDSLENQNTLLHDQEELIKLYDMMKKLQTKEFEALKLIFDDDLKPLFSYLTTGMDQLSKEHSGLKDEMAVIRDSFVKSFNELLTISLSLKDDMHDSLEHTKDIRKSTIEIDSNVMTVLDSQKKLSNIVGRILVYGEEILGNQETMIVKQKFMHGHIREGLDNQQILLSTLQEATENFEKFMEKNFDTLQETVKKTELVYGLLDQLGKDVADQNDVVSSNFSSMFVFIEKLYELFRLILSEWMLIQSGIYYTFGSLGLYILTSSRRTERARFYVFVVLVFNFVVEFVVYRNVVDWGMKDSVENTFLGLGILRKVLGGVCLVVVVYCGFVFEDVSRKNYRLLQENSKRLEKNFKMLSSLIFGVKYCMNGPSQEMDRSKICSVWSGRRRAIRNEGLSDDFSLVERYPNDNEN